ncbi:MAG: PqqD family peptide modification chaperone [Pseudomonadales bacterium]|nr:PqqD family peptide modification chaperone [Pseudomonadales bacterium]
MTSSSNQEISTVQLSTKISQSKSLVGCEMDGELVLMGIDSGNYYGFNAVLTRIWSLIAMPVTVAELSNQLLDIFEVDEELCRSQLLKVLDKMNNEGLIQVY